MASASKTILNKSGTRNCNFKFIHARNCSNCFSSLEKVSGYLAEVKADATGYDASAPVGVEGRGGEGRERGKGGMVSWG